MCVCEFLSFPPNTDLKLDNITIFFNMDKKVISTLDSSKTSGNDSIPVMVLKGQLISSLVLHMPPSNLHKLKCGKEDEAAKHTEK